MKIITPKALQLLVIFLCAQLCANSQKNFKEGYVVLKSGDTLQGQIDYRNWEVNPLRIQFQQHDIITVYTPAELICFEVKGNDVYKTATVKKNMRPADMATISSGIFSNDSAVADVVFLRVLVTGKYLNLYELVDSRKHYFIQSDTHSEPEELLYWLAQNNNDNSTQEKTMYKNQLAVFVSAASDPAAVIAKINGSKYNEESLVEITRLLNGADPGIARHGKPSSVVPVRIMAGAGISIFSFKFTGTQQQYSSLKFETGIGPVAGIAFDILGNRNMGRLGLRLAVTYSHLTYNGAFTGTDVNLNRRGEFKYKFVQDNIMPEVGVLCHFLEAKTLKMYFSGSMGIVFSSYPVNEYHTKVISTGEQIVNYNDIDFIKHWISPNVMVGAMLWNKLNLGISVKVAGQFATDDQYQGKMFPVGFMASYVFFSKK